MTEPSLDRFEARLWDAARAFPYPPTPDLSRALRLRSGGVRRPAARLPRWAMALAALAILLAALLIVPSVRAGVIQFLQIGAVRILVGPPTAPPNSLFGPTSVPTPPPLGQVLNLAGETQLQYLKGRLGFTVRLPQYPAGLGPPDGVFVQNLAGPAVILVWLDPADRSRVRLALHELSSSMMIEKANPVVLETTSVNGQAAIWTTGPYIVEATNQDMDFRYTVVGHVLIWAEGEVTYRLETDLSLKEAVMVAESLE
jgi:hypothetical protein